MKDPKDIELHNQLIQKKLEEIKPLAKIAIKIISGSGTMGLSLVHHSQKINDGLHEILTKGMEVPRTDLIRLIDLTNELILAVEHDGHSIDHAEAHHHSQGIANALKAVLPFIEELHHLIAWKSTSNHLDKMEERLALMTMEVGLMSQQILSLQTSATNLTSDVGSEITNAKTLFGEFKDFVNKHRKLTELMTEDVAGQHMAETYLKHAKRERLLVHAFRTIAILIMLSVFSFNVWLIHEFTFKGLSQPNTLLYIALTFVLLVPAAYLAREANKHRHTQLLYLKISQDLTAIVPFIASFPDAEKIKLKTAISLMVFSTSNQTSNEENPVFTNELIMKVLETVTEKLK